LALFYSTDGDDTICQVSESGTHSHFPWNSIDNAYYCDDTFVLMPFDFKPELDLVINALSGDNGSVVDNISKKITTDSNETLHLYEPDPWGWVRDGFYHGWTNQFNFTFKNGRNVSQRFDITNSIVPVGLAVQLYQDSNGNGIFEPEDPLLGFDEDFDGYWDPVVDFDDNENGFPDVLIESNSSATFFVFIRADYSLHFSHSYKLTMQSSDTGELIFTKETLYYTETMRLFVIPKGSAPVKSEQITMSTRKAEDITYYYGEWSGAGGSQIEIGVQGPSSEDDDGDGDFSKGIGTFLIIAGVLFAVVFGFFVFRNKSKGRHRSTKKKGMKRDPSEDKEPSQRGTKPTPTEDKKAKKQQEKVYDALLRLEEDFDAGSIDKETYDSSKGIYLDYLKELKKK